MKPLCETRWESRIDAIAPFWYQIEEIYDALYELSKDPDQDNKERGMAFSLAKEIYLILSSMFLLHDIVINL